MSIIIIIYSMYKYIIACLCILYIIVYNGDLYVLYDLCMLLFSSDIQMIFHFSWLCSGNCIKQKEANYVFILSFA